MKINRILAAVIGVLAVVSVSVHAEEDVIGVSVDNAAVTFDEGQTPIIVDGHTLVPVRAVFEQTGAIVTWDQASLTATIVRGDVTVTIACKASEMYRNGQSIELECPAEIINDRIMIPVRAIAEAMDFAVTWDGHHSLVYVSTNGKPYRPYAFLRTGFRTLEGASELFSSETDYENIDLDGDGNPETIEFSSAEDMSVLAKPVLLINGMDYSAGLGALSSVYSLAIVDINANDGKKEIVVTENGDILTAHFYRYENGILKVISDSDGPTTVKYAENLFISGTGYMISDLAGTCFVDIMVTGGVYRLEDDVIKLYRMRSIESIYGRDLYRTYNDNMLYHVIYTDTYNPGSYKDVTNTGVTGSGDLAQFKILNGYMDVDNPNYIELYIELPDGAHAVIKPYGT